MRWCLFLIWAQGLRQAARLISESVEGAIVTQGNILAKEGGSVILQCYLSSTTANVTQVDWEQQDQLLAIYHPHFGWYVNPVFSERVSPGPSKGLTFHLLTMNDTGEYFCIYHTYPDGIYRGRIFLEVRESSGAGNTPKRKFREPYSFQVPAAWLEITVTGLSGRDQHLVPDFIAWSCGRSTGDYLCNSLWGGGTGQKDLRYGASSWALRLQRGKQLRSFLHGSSLFGAWRRQKSKQGPDSTECYNREQPGPYIAHRMKASLPEAGERLRSNLPQAWKKSLRIHSVESSLGRMPAEQQEGSPSFPSSLGSCVQAEAAPAGLCGEQRGDDCAELHEYFNVLGYRSLGSFSFLGETG
ncbi:T-cell immunoreceptor with Ig and ITIM domains [Erethizon dorsatum]